MVIAYMNIDNDVWIGFFRETKFQSKYNEVLTYDYEMLYKNSIRKFNVIPPKAINHPYSKHYYAIKDTMCMNR